MGYRVVVVGATGNVGREMMNVLAEREFPCDEVAAVASPRSQGTEVEFGDTGKMLRCQNIENFDFTGWDIALFSAGSGVAKDYGPKAAAQGCVVIDNSSYWRMDPDVPLIVPEVNPDAIDGYKKKMIIANPNCSTAQMVVALKPLHDAATITARGGGDLSVDLRRGQGRDGRAVRTDPGRVHALWRDARADQVHQADRLQRHSPH